MKEIKVVELFAGVGGFRIGLERADADVFKTIWSNQFEPSTKTQHASRTYVRAFGEDGHVNEDIAKVNVLDIPDHDMLVGGFPCQDYSVANTLSRSKGIVGKKGVLWWEIYRILSEKGDNAPKILFFENVDRLIQSPAKQRGRDFAIILSSLSNLGYAIEWRVINAAEYGMPQRRRRTYIVAYKTDSCCDNFIDVITTTGVMAKAFPVHEKIDNITLFNIEPDLTLLSEEFNYENKHKMFENAGFVKNGRCATCKVTPDYSGPYTTLGDIVLKAHETELRETITEDYYLSDEDVKKWEYAKGAKKFERVNKDGQTYMYSEGGMSFPDPLDKPSRTIITSEMTKSANRFTHVILDPVDNRYRRLVPVELERLNMFPDNHTAGETDNKRGFFMGNALVCGVVEKVGKIIKEKFCN